MITFFVYVKKRIQKHINEYKRIDIDFSFKVCQKVSLFGKIINAEWLNSQLPIPMQQDTLQFIVFTIIRHL